MYHTVFATGTIASVIKNLEEGDESVVRVSSVKSFTDGVGALHASTLNFIVHMPTKVAEEMKPALVKGVRVSLRGTLIGNELGAPIIRDDEKRGLWTAFDIRATGIKAIGILAEGQLQTDEFYTVLAGNLGRDPEMRYIPDGTAVTSFSVAVNSGHREGTEFIKETIWVKVTAWRKQAETAQQWLHKGNKVLVEGNFVFDPETGAPRLWDRNDGTKGSSFELTLFSYKMLEKKSDGAPSTYQGDNAFGGSGAPGGEYNAEEDIPF